MTLARRISIMVSLVIGATALAIAVLSAFSGRASSLQRIDERLLKLRDAATASDDPVRALLTRLDAAPSDLVAYLQVEDEPPISLVDAPSLATDRPFGALTDTELDAAASSPITRGDGSTSRLFSISLGDEQWLVVGESIDDILSQFQRQLLTNSLIALALALMGGLLAATLARRALAPLQGIVEYSGAVASGQLEANLSDDATTREVRELQTSIGTMVTSLREAAERKARSEADMRVFLADIAHELRTPLTTVRAYADVLASTTPADPEVRERAQQRVAQESKRMSRLIDDLLLLARLASTKLGETSAFDLGELVRDHFSDLKVLDPHRQIDVTCSECQVEGDRALLERVFANLVSNIHRHTPANAGVVVSCTRGDDFVTCLIEDAGPGLDDPQLRELAEGAQRFGRFRSDDRHGTGLGLHLIASIVRSHGGSTSFERSSLGGLRVTVSLPRPSSHSR
jgi:two-component system OmpR family sensor kinase